MSGTGSTVIKCSYIITCINELQIHKCELMEHLLRITYCCPRRNMTKRPTKPLPQTRTRTTPSKAQERPLQGSHYVLRRTAVRAARMWPLETSIELRLVQVHMQTVPRKTRSFKKQLSGMRDQDEMRMAKCW